MRNQNFAHPTVSVSGNVIPQAKIFAHSSTEGEKNTLSKKKKQTHFIKHTQNGILDSGPESSPEQLGLAGIVGSSEPTIPNGGLKPAQA